GQPSALQDAAHRRLGARGERGAPARRLDAGARPLGREPRRWAQRAPTEPGVSSRTTADTLPGLDIEGLGLGPLRLEDLIDREALRLMAASFAKLSGIPIRIVSASG